MPDSVKLCVASSGNEFMVDIARLFAAGFNAAGASAVVALDDEALQDDGSLPIVVAPHEFYPLYAEGAVAPGRLVAFRARAVLLNVEQPGSPWFERAAAYARGARGVVDIHEEGAAELRRRGIRALHAALGYAEYLTHAPLDRDIDVLFLGVSSPRRAVFFARYGELFARYRCHVALARVSAPRTADTPGYISGDERLALCARSRILLNVHAQASSYFESHRALLAVSNGCVLVSETSSGTGPLVAGRHFAMGDVDELPSLCAELLDHEGRRAKLAEAARTLFTGEHRMDEVCRRLLVALGGLDGNPAPVRGTTAAALHLQARAALQTRNAQTLSARSAGVVDHDLITNLAYDCSSDPAVSVVVPLYNYEGYIEECLRSVEKAEPVPGGVEVVVVDDCSSDGSRDRVAALMLRSELPIALVTKATNTGLGDTRNTGWRAARAPFVFFLDADNWIHPACLRVLQEAIRREGCAAVYGLIRTFQDGSGEPLGLLSEFAWSVRDLVAAPYIDAMAMFERRVLMELGGYSTDLLQHGWQGWEDYDLWLSLALAGHEARRVPQVLASYRVHPASMINSTKLDTFALARHFEEKFRALVVRWPELDRRFGFPVTSLSGAVAMVSDDTLAEIDSRCHELELELDAMYTSKSWTVTAPLRAGYDAFLRLRAILPRS